MTPEQAAKVSELATYFDVSFEVVDSPHSSRTDFGLDLDSEIVVYASDYLTALHEFGHVNTLRSQTADERREAIFAAMFDNLSGTYGSARLTVEAEAWLWARRQDPAAFKPDIARDALATYYHAAASQEAADSSPAFTKLATELDVYSTDANEVYAGH